LVAYLSRHLRKPTIRRGKGVTVPIGCGGKRVENRKKILNRGNELKDLLQIKDLAHLGAKNELKTNWFLCAKTPHQCEKRGLKAPGCGAWRGTGNRGTEIGNWKLENGKCKLEARAARSLFPLSASPRAHDRQYPAGHHLDVAPVPRSDWRRMRIADSTFESGGGAGSVRCGTGILPVRIHGQDGHATSN